MKTLILFLFSAALAWAAEITITVKNDAGKVVNTTTILTNDATIQALNQWRLGQLVSPGVLKYPTAEALWRAIIGTFVRPILADHLPSIIAERAKIDAAVAAIEKLKLAAVPE